MSRRGKTIIAVGSMSGAFLLGGAAYGVVQFAGATAPGTTFYACLSKAGALSHVGTVAPSCTGTTTQISWNSTGPEGSQGVQGETGNTGPQGPVGPQGLSSAQYEAQNAWAWTSSPTSNVLPNLPAGKTLTITSVTGPFPQSCNISGSLNGNTVTYTWGGTSGTFSGAITSQPSAIAGLQWSFSTGTPIIASCAGTGISGYLS